MGIPAAPRKCLWHSGAPGSSGNLFSALLQQMNARPLFRRALVVALTGIGVVSLTIGTASAVTCDTAPGV